LKQSREALQRLSKGPLQRITDTTATSAGLALLFPPSKAPAPNTSFQPPVVGQSDERRSAAEQERLEADG
jgi:hypothetical protein